MPSELSPAAEPLELFDRNLGLAGALAGRFWRREDLRLSLRRRGYEREDLDQICRLALWLAARRYDPGRGARLSTYFHGIARNAVFDVLRPQRGRVPVEALRADVRDGRPAVAELVHFRLLGRTIAQRLEALPAYLREAVCEFAESGTLVELAAREGVTRQAIQHRLGVARRRLRGGLGDDFGPPVAAGRVSNRNAPRRGRSAGGPPR